MIKVVLPHVALFFAALVVGSILSYTAIVIDEKNTQLEALTKQNSPVVTRMTIKDVAHEDGRLLVKMAGVKERSCGPPIAITGVYGDNLEFQFESIKFLDDEREDGQVDVPDGKEVNEDEVSFGWWALSPNITDKNILMNVFHMCDGHIVNTVLGPYNIPKD